MKEWDESKPTLDNYERYKDQRKFNHTKGWISSFGEWNTEMQVCQHMFPFKANKRRINIVLISTGDTAYYNIYVNM
jgi:hypothetical protein